MTGDDRPMACPTHDRRLSSARPGSRAVLNMRMHPMIMRPRTGPNNAWSERAKDNVPASRTQQRIARRGR